MRSLAPRPARRSRRMAALLVAATIPVSTAVAQNFVAVTDSTNPIVIEQLPGTVAYAGASWVDLDDDGLLDLFMSPRGAIFHNLGGGTFERVAGVVPEQGQSLGNTWADYDNDGDLDVFVVAGTGGFNHKGSFLYRNDGNLSFAKVTTGDIADSLANTGWGCAWADFDADGWTDLVVAAANNFGGVTHVNRLFRNVAGTLVDIDSTVITDSLDAYTIPTWSDYDLDGDPDLFIGSGQVSSLDPDNHFRNVLAESGGWGFERITTAPIATDSLNGQVWNWIDYDNDGDLDAYQTNYGLALANNLYRNDAGTYVKMTESDVGTIVSDIGSGLANNWADFDNDGDLDCLVTNDAGGKCDYFSNDGDGTFTQDLATAVVQDNGPRYGATAGDYDNDGDLDLYIHGQTATKALFRNDLANGYGWVNLRLVGAGPPTGSNVAAIGARVRLRAVIDGSPVWQMREVSSQNSFNCMNMINVHFGLKDAAVIDSLVIDWPSGAVSTFTGMGRNRFYTLTEGQDPTAAPRVGVRVLPGLDLVGIPNPFVGSTRISLEAPAGRAVELAIYDVGGRRVRTLPDPGRSAGRRELVWDGRDERGQPTAAGVYLVRARSRDASGDPVEDSLRLVRRR